LFQQRDLLVAMHSELDVMLGQHRQIVGIEETLQQQDGLGPAQFTQAHCIVRLHQRQTIGGGEAAHGAFQPVTVAIGLEHAPDTGLGRVGAGHGEIMLKRGNADGSEDRSWHDVQWGMAGKEADD
jgi:hypothetical protein